MRVNIDNQGRITLLDFGPVQAFKIALHMEEQGIEFYQGLARQVKDAEARREIDFLIDQEREHREIFANLLRQEKEQADDAFEEDDIVNYLNSKVFDRSLEPLIAKGVEHRHTALEQALHMERRSIVFYEACLARTTDAVAKDAFEKILDEEKHHLAKFSEMMRVKCINSSKGCVL